MANKTPAPQFKPLKKDEYYRFDSGQYPDAGTYDPEFGIKKGKGLNGFASLICWLSKDKQKFHVKYNLGPYDWGSK